MSFHLTHLLTLNFLSMADPSLISDLTEDFVRLTILSSPLKTCELDTFPTTLLLECLDSLFPCITAVFNNSLVSGVFPSVYKSALVKPLLKKMSLDRDDLKNYRPVSNLSFLSKFLERIVLSQLNEHLTTTTFSVLSSQPTDPTTALKLPCSGSLTTF